MTPTVRCAALAAALTSLTSPAQTNTGEELLLGAEVKPQGIDFKVRTGGCTSKANFGLETVSATPLTVRLVRIRPDHCEAYVPDGTSVVFTFAEIGAGPVLNEQAQKNLVITNIKP